MVQITADIKIAKDFLEKGNVVAIPTETVYGLAGNIYNSQTINKIFELKKRPFYNPLIVHIKSIDYLKNVAVDVPDVALKLAETFWPGPLTLILKKHPSISEIITAGKDTVAVRVPKHPLTLSLLNELAFPLAAPSANPFGLISPTTASHVAGYFKNNLDAILDGGPCEMGLESTIIGFPDGKITLYRHGSISIEAIEGVVGKIEVAVLTNDSAPDAPGMISKHYAPVTPTYLVENIEESLINFSGKKIGMLFFKNGIDDSIHSTQIILSASGNLEEASAKLYASLHILDKADVDIILVERFPSEGLGRTINDRLERAAKR